MAAEKGYKPGDKALIQFGDGEWRPAELSRGFIWATPDGSHHLAAEGGFDARPLLATAETAAMPEHEFRPVAGHPDDDECSYRADGTDVTYCGQSRAWHDHHPRCYQNAGVPDDLPADLCDCRVLRMIEQVSQHDCSCPDGPYYGAQRADEPVRCLRCNLPAPDLSTPPGATS